MRLTSWILAFITLTLYACSSSKVLMTMESMRLIASTANPQEVMDFANNNCLKDFYRGASFISKSGNEYTFRCIKFDDAEPLIPVPGSSIKAQQKK